MAGVTMKSTGKVLIGTMFWVGLVTTLLFLQLKKPHILIIHPFDPNDANAKLVDQGVKKFLDEKHSPVDVQWHYLNLQSYRSPSSVGVVYSNLRKVLDQYDPDVVVAVDDQSNIAAANVIRAYPNVRLLYASLDATPDHYGYRKTSKISGIIEVLPMQAVADLLQQTYGGKPLRIGLLGTSAYTSTAEIEQVKQFPWYPHQLVRTQIVSTSSELRNCVREFNETVDVLLVIHYEGLGNATKKAAENNEETIREIEQNFTGFPIGLQVSYVANGGSFAIGPSRPAYGYLAMKMGLDWLYMRSGSDVPTPSKAAHYDVALREVPLKKRKLPIPSIYFEAARAGSM